MSNKWCLAIDSNTKYVTLNWYFQQKKILKQGLKASLVHGTRCLLRSPCFFYPQKRRQRKKVDHEG